MLKSGPGPGHLELSAWEVAVCVCSVPSPRTKSSICSWMVLATSSLTCWKTGDLGQVFVTPLMIIEQPRLNCCWWVSSQACQCSGDGWGWAGWIFPSSVLSTQYFNYSRNFLKSLTCMPSFPRAQSHAYPIYCLRIWRILSTSPIWFRQASLEEMSEGCNSTQFYCFYLVNSYKFCVLSEKYIFKRCKSPSWLQIMVIRWDASHLIASPRINSCQVLECPDSSLQAFAAHFGWPQHSPAYLLLIMETISPY